MGITLLDMLKNAGLITKEQFDEALRNRVVFGGKIGTSLIELGFVHEDDLARFLSSKLAVPYVPPERLLSIPPETIALITPELALKYRVIPIHRDKKRLYLVMADPADLEVIAELTVHSGFAIKPLITPEVRLIQALGKYYQFQIDRRYQHIIDRFEQMKRDKTPAVPSDLEVVTLLPAVSAPEEELEEAEIIADNDWVERIGSFSIDSVSRELSRAEDREEIATIIMSYLGQEFDRVALFVIRGETAFGWKGIRKGAELMEFDRVGIPLNAPSVIKTIVDGKSYYLGAIPDTPMNGMLIDSLGGGIPAAALFMPLVITGRVANILYVEGGEKDLGERFADLHRLLTKAALAFEILIFREKILMI